MKNILCIIPARSGSKGIKNKNIMPFNNKPLLVWSILQAKACKYKMKIIVSTDNKEYAKIATENGAETPFLRPQNISGDKANDFSCINHCVNWIEKNEKYNVDIILHLRPTQPCRKIEDIDKCLEIFINNYNELDSLRSVIEVEKSPYKMYNINEKGNLKPLFNEILEIKECYNEGRQLLPKSYLHNGYIDILKRDILKNNTISGKIIYPFIMNKENNIDIDYVKDIPLKNSFNSKVFNELVT